MNTDDPIEGDGRPNQSASYSGLITLAIAGMVAAAGLLFLVFRPQAPPAPPEIQSDPLLARGRTLYLDRCVSCHGQDGSGNGPIAKGVSGPEVRNLKAAQWKYGDKPEDVLRIISKGTDNSSMPGWLSTLGPDGVRAVAAYVYYLGERPVPEALRAGAPRRPDASARADTAGRPTKRTQTPGEADHHGGLQDRDP